MVPELIVLRHDKKRRQGEPLALGRKSGAHAGRSHLRGLQLQEEAQVVVPAAAHLKVREHQVLPVSLPLLGDTHVGDLVRVRVARKVDEDEAVVHQIEVYALGPPRLGGRLGRVLPAEAVVDERGLARVCHAVHSDMGQPQPRLLRNGGVVAVRHPRQEAGLPRAPDAVHVVELAVDDALHHLLWHIRDVDAPHPLLDVFAIWRRHVAHPLDLQLIVH
mmetsp:Transcript_83765/g.222300  ORF Transcript_83765/g.222300 Transcript_83765/m.222300 type:complete len:218 (-) Transcript_83765:452-1105(-)